jgi:peptidoglycan hydrolase FlgJ
MAVDGVQGAAYTDLQALQGLRREARQPDSQAVREAARQFETLFTRMMLQSMRQASVGDSLFDSNESSFYRDMFDDQLAVEMSRGRGLGLAALLSEQLARAGYGGEETAKPPVQGAPASVGRQAEGKMHPAAGAPSVDRAPVRDAGGADLDTRRAFVERLRPAAEEASRALGVAPETLLGHAALETGWGRDLPRGADGSQSFNLFGIKATGAWRGEVAQASTLEYLDGRAQRRIEPFRAYDSESASFADYASLLARSPRYAGALGAGSDAAAFANALQRGGYATDPQYARKLTAVVQSVQALSDVALKSGHSLPINEADAG